MHAQESGGFVSFRNCPSGSYTTRPGGLPRHPVSFRRYCSATHLSTSAACSCAGTRQCAKMGIGQRAKPQAFSRPSPLHPSPVQHDRCLLLESAFLIVLVSSRSASLSLSPRGPLSLVFAQRVKLFIFVFFLLLVSLLRFSLTAS